MKKAYIITQDVKVPDVVGGGTAHKQAQVRFRMFKKNQIIEGELKHANNKPAFVLVGRMLCIPIECVKELQSKDITSSFAGADMDEKKDTPKITTPLTVSNPKVQYLDAILIGGAIGFLGAHYAMKKGYLPDDDKKVRVYAAIGCAILGAYFVYRSQAIKNSPVKTEKK